MNSHFESELDKRYLKDCYGSKLYYMKKWIYMLSPSEKQSVLPKFGTEEEASIGMRSHNYIFKGVNEICNEKLLFVIQMERDKSGNMYTGEYFGYTINEDMKLFMLAQLLSIKMQEIKKTIKCQSNYKRNRDSIYCLTSLIIEKSYPSLLIKMQKTMPSYFNFNKAFVLLYSKQNQELTLFDECFLEGNSKGMLKFVAHQGLTMDAINSKKIVISQQGSNDPAYKAETDNVSSYLIINNMACCPLLDENGDVVAVLQLINKNNDSITDKDRVDY